MKLTRDEVSHMREAMRPLTDAARAHETGLRQLPRYASGSGDVGMRLRWDWLRAAGLMPWATGLYKRGCNDDHIDTALRVVVADLMPKEVAP